LLLGRFNGIVDDTVMQQFYDSHLYASKPALPKQFVFTCVNPRVCGSKAGIQMLQVHDQVCFLADQPIALFNRF